MVQTCEEGIRIDSLLQKRFSGSYHLWSRARIQKRIREKKIQINGRFVRSSRRVQAGDEISYYFYAKVDPPVQTQIGICYQDEDIIVVEKPSNLPVHPSGAYQNHTLYSILKQRCLLEKRSLSPQNSSDSLFLGPVHRLDRETSGLMILAKNPSAARVLQSDFQNGLVKKEYLSLVEGYFPDFMNADGWIFLDTKSKVRKKRSFSETSPISSSRELGKIVRCRTEFSREKYNSSYHLSLVRAQLHTGRTHQIRATLCSKGYPVVGDRIYGINDHFYLNFIEGKETELDLKQLRMNRTALHACSLEFVHPVSSEKLCFASKIPKEISMWMEEN